MLSLTATELPRFMACNGSKMLSGFEPLNTPSQVTEEGNAVHWFAEKIIRGEFSSEELIDRQAPNGIFITQEMAEHVEQYIADSKAVNGAPETDTSYKSDSWEIRGRADLIGVKNDELHVYDLKYGWRIVEPYENWTLISHAIAIFRQRNDLQKIVFKIYQPRPYHPLGSIREWVITQGELHKYFENLMQTLSNPSEISVSGKHCEHCKCFTNCPAAQISLMNAIDVSRIAFDSNVSNDNLSRILENIDRAKNVLKEAEMAYTDLAFSRVKEGNVLKGYQMQNALGITTWKEGVTPEYVEMMTGKDITVKKMMTPTEAKKAGVSEDFIASHVYRPNKGFKLVKVDENKLAQKLFGKEKK